MIDNYAWFSIIIRGVAELIFVGILVQQVRNLKGKNDYKWLQLLLLVALVSLTLGNGFTLGLNFYRQGDGNLQEVARHAGTVVSALSALGAAVSLWLINKFKLK